MIRSEWIKESEGVSYIVGDISNIEKLFITTDSRKIENKNTYIALYGERFDGFNFCEEVVNKDNIDVIIYENKDSRRSLAQEWSSNNPAKVFIAVDNIFEYLLSLAKTCCLEFKKRDGKIIALTGSNGKTTNKEMIAYLLSCAIGEKKVHFTKGNLNNHIGVPLTVFDIQDNHDVAIIEMGTNHPGEIKTLCDAIGPEYGMITNIGYAHIEYLKSLDGVLEEKSSLYYAIADCAQKKKAFILNGFDVKLKSLEMKSWVRRVDKENTVITKDELSISLGANQYIISNNSLAGDHQKINMAMGLSLCFELYPKLINEMIKAAQCFELKGMNRGEVKEFDNLKIYLDAYNANPSSMIASLRSFEALLENEKILKKDSLLILGDMNEIGEMTHELHKEITLKAMAMGFRDFIFVGRFANSYKEGCRDAVALKSLEELKCKFKKCTANKNFIFIKGSRSLQLESILDIYKD